MRFRAGLGRGLKNDRAAAARAIFSSFEGLTRHEYRFRSALVLTDALAGHAEDLVEQLTIASGGTYQLFGGGAGDDGRFSRTHVFYGTEAISDAAVALEILSNKPLGVGVRHPWHPAGAALRVTAAEGMRLISLNAMPAQEAFEEHARSTNQRFDPENPLPFFLHNVLGIVSDGGHKLRVPLSVNADGSISCAAEIPTGAVVYIMTATEARPDVAVSDATTATLEQIKGHKPKVALFFDCVATRLRMGADFGEELRALEEALGDAAFVGCNTYGQIARAEGQFGGFHNCTAVVCVIPE